MSPASMSKNKVCILSPAQKQSFVALGRLPKCSDCDHAHVSPSRARDLVGAGKITSLLDASGESSVPDVFVWVRRGVKRPHNPILTGYSVPVAAISFAESMAAVGISSRPNDAVSPLRQRMARQKIAAYSSTH